ncbi:MAG: phosphatidate cytidylyltransferase [Deltaproteobacteria bacterium]|nr:phosphatidate cytidylyltransferase [Deltaproteobacteria bacterium]
MHLKRWITAVAALPFLILLVVKGGPLLFAIFIGIVSIMALWEYHRIVLNPGGANRQGVIPILGYVVASIIIGAAHFNSFRMMLILIALNLIFAALISLPQFKSNTRVTENVIRQVLGIIYIPLFLSFLVFIRNGPDGIIWIFFLLIVIFAGDTGAFYVGSYFGRHKLCPSISPGKTIEGSVGGLIANLGIGIPYMRFFLPSLPWGTGILFLLSIGAAGQVGDLFESQLKRAGDIKDSGGILPGHGGILDRIDALLFAAPLAYLFK